MILELAADIGRLSEENVRFQDNFTANCTHVRYAHSGRGRPGAPCVPPGLPESVKRSKTLTSLNSSCGTSVHCPERSGFNDFLNQPDCISDRRFGSYAPASVFPQDFGNGMTRHYILSGNLEGLSSPALLPDAEPGPGTAGTTTLAGSLNPRAAIAKTSLAEPVSAFRRCFIVPPSPCTIWQWRNGRHAFSICPCHDLPFLCRADSRAANDNTELSGTIPLAAGAPILRSAKPLAVPAPPRFPAAVSSRRALTSSPRPGPPAQTTSPHHSVESEHRLPYRKTGPAAKVSFWHSTASSAAAAPPVA